MSPSVQLWNYVSSWKFYFSLIQVSEVCTERNFVFIVFMSFYIYFL